MLHNYNSEFLGVNKPLLFSWIYLNLQNYVTAFADVYSLLQTCQLYAFPAH